MLLHGIVIQSDIRITRISQLTLSNGFSRDEELWEDCVEIPWDWDWIWSLVSRYLRIVMLDFDGTCDCYVIFWWDTTWKTCTADFSEAASEIQHFHTLRCFSQFGRSSTSCSHPTTPIRAELDDLMMKVQVHYISPFTSLSTLTLPLNLNLNPNSQPQHQLSTSTLNLPLPIGPSSSVQHSPWLPICKETSSWKMSNRGAGSSFKPQIRRMVKIRLSIEFSPKNMANMWARNNLKDASAHPGLEAQLQVLRAPNIKP